MIVREAVCGQIGLYNMNVQIKIDFKRGSLWSNRPLQHEGNDQIKMDCKRGSLWSGAPLQHDGNVQIKFYQKFLYTET